MQVLLHYTWTKAQNSHLEFAFQFLQTWVFSGRNQREGWAQSGSPARTRGTEVTANKCNGLEPSGNTNLWNQHLWSLLQTQAPKNTWYGKKATQMKRGKYQLPSHGAENVSMKPGFFRIQVSEDIKQPLLQRISSKKHRSTCWILKICTEINNNRVFHGAFHLFADSWVSVLTFLLSKTPEYC